MVEQPLRELRRLPKFVRDISFRPTPDIAGGERPDLVDDHELSSPELHIGTYNSNNGMVAYVDGNAEVFCIPMGLIPYMFHNSLGEKGLTQETYRKIENIYGERASKIMGALQEAGYVSSRENFWVPHSNDAGAWAYNLLTESKFLPRIQRQVDMEKRNRRLGVESRLVLADQFSERFKPAWEEFESFEHWVKTSGMYNANNGVLVYVDQHAIPHVAPYEEGLREGLRASGFEIGHVFVPHSNDAGAWLHYMFPRELERIYAGHGRRSLEAQRREAGIVVIE